MDNVTSVHVEVSYWIQKKNKEKCSICTCGNFLLDTKEKQIKVLKHTPKINADIVKDINTAVVQVLSENKLPYPVENMIPPSKYLDNVIMTSLFHNFENS